MASQIATSVKRALRRAVSTPPREDVHFHVDGHGRPFVCDHHRCESLGLASREADLIAS